MNTDNGIVAGIDFGTQALKMSLFSLEGKLVWRGERSYPTVFPLAGRAEQQPEDWWKALIEVLQEAAKCISLSRIEGIGVCATSSTVLVTDNVGVPQTPALLWMDKRAIHQAKAINENESHAVKEVLQYSGGKVSEEWMVAKALYLKDSGFLPPGTRIMEQLDWINFRLTGRWVASQCNAVCKWNYQVGKGFSSAFFEAIGLPDYQKIWPDEIIPVGGKVGRITKEAAAELGLTPGIPVFQGGIDAHIGMLGAGAVEPGVMSLVMGTSFVHLVHTAVPIFHEGLWGPYENAILPDKWLIEGGQLSCGSLTSWFLQQFYPHVPEDELGSVYEEVVKEAGKIAPGSDGLVMMDSWQGNRTPYRNPLASGSLVGLTLAHTRFHIFRAILESTAYGTRNIIETFTDSHVPITRIIACGGGTKNELWMQILSDVTGLVIETLEETEAGSKGAAILAAYGLGRYPSLADAANSNATTGRVFTPQQEARERYDRYFDAYLDLHRALFPIMKELSVT
ncbi:FGGY-family carbohydrate kinase [Brevibacillus nitrificans]|uniref:FGGY-family carbohydrate kinase n=1 Tax=Brevibacillus nitrificans TaxID=651560 RepID=UPI002E1E5288|nr:FGGY-family carbohydrate kinase [Brevibacillus nitrificans]